MTQLTTLADIGLNLDAAELDRLFRPFLDRYVEAEGPDFARLCGQCLPAGTEASGNAWRYLVVDTLSRDWCSNLWQVRADDDTRVLSRGDPTNAAVIYLSAYLSALKLRRRIEAGLYDDSAFAVVPATANPSGCSNSR
jgi:hypothetical protein